MDGGQCAFCMLHSVLGTIGAETNAHLFTYAAPHVGCHADRSNQCMFLAAPTAGAVGFFAMREFERRREAEGMGGNHALAK